MRRPNILLLYTDQQRWDALGVNRNREIRTPHLDALAAQGLNFDHYFVQNPVCMPSRASLLTGQYPSTLRITHMGVPVPRETMTLPMMLKNYGYVSANIGKLHFLPHANRDHREIHPPYGFDHLEISDEPGCYEDAYRAWVRLKAPDQLDSISVGLPPAAETWYGAMGIRDTVNHPDERTTWDVRAFRGASHLTHSAFVAEQSIDFITAHHEQSWLCVAGFYSPHHPWVTPQEFLDLYDPATLTIPSYPPDACFPLEAEARRSEPRFSEAGLRAARHGYYAMLSEVDQHVGRILGVLDDLKLADDTIVVFISDHGDWLGEHLRYGKGYPGDDSVSRVPCIIRWPRAIHDPGRTVSAIVEAVDIIPTLLHCCGIPLPAYLQGTSLVPAFADGAFSGRDSALMEHSGWKNLRTRQYRYVVESGGKEALYDLERDPGEYFDVSGDPAYREPLSEMRRRLLDRLLQIEQPLPRCWPY